MLYITFPRSDGTFAGKCLPDLSLIPAFDPNSSAAYSYKQKRMFVWCLREPLQARLFAGTEAKIRVFGAQEVLLAACHEAISNTS